MGYVIYIVNDHERMARTRDVFFFFFLKISSFRFVLMGRAGGL